MSDAYSLYEAKAKLSALVRQVREGRSVIITVHGRPVAELRPLDRRDRTQSLEERIDDLTGRGIVVAARQKPSDPGMFRVGERKLGALKRFLDDRD